MRPKPSKEIPALYGGIIIALIINIPFINIINYCLCCSGIMLGGFFAVMFYKNDFTPETPPFTAGDCLTVGGLSGLVGAAIGTLLWAVTMALFGNYLAGIALHYIQQMSIPEFPPQMLDELERSINEHLSFVEFFFKLLMNVIINIVFGSFGGLIAYNIYKPKYPHMPPPMYPPPPPSQPPVS